MRATLLILLLLGPPALAGALEDATRLFEGGDYSKAAATLSPALDDAARRPRALLLMTRIQNELADYEQGVDYGKQAVAALPDSSDAHLQYAVALSNKMQQVSKMKAMFVIGPYKKELKKALELDPRSVDARVEEIGFLIYAPSIAGGDKAKARDRIDALKPLDWREAMFMQAELQRTEEDTQGAIATFGSMLERDPKDASARQQLAFALQGDGRYRDADPHFALLLEGEDERRALMARYQLARSRILGKYDAQQAVDYLLDYIDRLSGAVRGVPSESHAYWRLGLAYQQLNRLDEARRSLKKAIELDDENKEARTALKSLG